MVFRDTAHKFRAKARAEGPSGNRALRGEAVLHPPLPESVHRNWIEDLRLLVPDEGSSL